jgi:hypothetical protein
VAQRQLHDALAGVDDLQGELQLADDNAETMRGEMMALAERIAFERYTSREEVAALEASHSRVDRAWFLRSGYVWFLRSS